MYLSVFKLSLHRFAVYFVSLVTRDLNLGHLLFTEPLLFVFVSINV